MADVPSPPLCPTRDKKKMENVKNAPLTPLTLHQEKLGMQELTRHSIMTEAKFKYKQGGE